MKEIKISSFTLERYRLGELNPEDNLTIRNALVNDSSLRLSLKDLEDSDRELREYYSFESLNLPRASAARKWPIIKNRFTGKHIAGIAMMAAGVMLLLFLPILIITQNGFFASSGSTGLQQGILTEHNNMQDRAKGSTLTGIELSVYLKGNEDAPLEDLSVLREGSTVQLAYTMPAGAEHYGVIFSIDGRSEITMHYPYRAGQSSILVSGRKTFLNEAYILDDAPDYEVFIMVISDEPLEVSEILRRARRIADNELIHIQEKSAETFEDYDVAILTVIKD